MGFLANNCPPDSNYAKVLKHEFDSVRDSNDSWFYHDYLEPVNCAFYFHEFAEQIAGAGLQYMADTRYSYIPPSYLPQNARATLTNLSAIEQEQNLDFLVNRSFRRSLLCHADKVLERNPDAQTLNGFQLTLAMPIKSPDIELKTDKPISFKVGELKIASNEPIVKAAFCRLADCWPGWLSYEQLRASALEILPSDKRRRSDNDVERGKEELTKLLIMFHGAELLRLWLHPPAEPAKLSKRPIASSIAREQAPFDCGVTNYLHQQIKLDDLERYLVRVLDGQCDKNALVDRLRCAFANDGLEITENGQSLSGMANKKLFRLVESALVRLKDAGLLVG